MSEAIKTVEEAQAPSKDLKEYIARRMATDARLEAEKRAEMGQTAEADTLPEFDNEGRRVLCPSGSKVAGDTLPSSMRHMSRQHALEDARSIGLFLRDAVSELMTDEAGGVSDRSAFGCFLVFDLMLDKLAVAAGDMSFPFDGGKDALCVCSGKW